MLENDPNICNEIRQWLEREEGSEHNLQEQSPPLPIIEEEKVASIVGNSGSNSYNPNPIEINVGYTVTWINDDSSPHTVTSSNGSTLDSDLMERGETFGFTFDNVGEYPYLCTLHPSMVGIVIVTASQG